MEEVHAARQRPRLLDEAEVGGMLRTPRATLRYWRHTGTGPTSLKVGRRVLYRESDVLAWLDACEQKASAAS